MNRQILVVGCGSIGERHLRCLQKSGRTEVVACESSPTVLERMGQEYRVAGFANFNEALNSQTFDGVVICTPAHTHIPLALTALRAGAALLIEKPLSTSLESIGELQQEIAKTKRFVAVAYVYHFLPAIAAAREFLQQGALGIPLQVSVVAGQHFPTFRPAYREIYYTRHETGGGAVQDALTHLINAVEWLVGPTNRIACEARHQALEGVEVEDTVSVSARTMVARVPVGTSSAASFPRISAARRSSRFTVGSSPYTSSPTSASAMARRISGVGLVTVSLRRSMIIDL